MFETNKKPVDKQKLRGGYYTPIKLARYLAKWAIRSGTENVLEPSAGDGNFAVAILGHCLSNRQNIPSIVAIEIENEEIQKAKNRVVGLDGGLTYIEWINGDFFSEYEQLRKREGFDVVLGNPPFIRFQYFDDEMRKRAFFSLQEAGYKPNKLANAWVAFIELSIELIKEGGRMAMVVPAELLQVKYASELRSRLSKKFRHIMLIGFRKLVFPEIQQEVLLLLAEDKQSNATLPSDIHTIEFEDGEDLIARYDLTQAITHVSSKHSRNGMKWTSLFLSDDTFHALDEAQKSKKLVPLGELASVDIGIVTGRNSYFVLNQEFKNKIEAGDYSIPIIGKTNVLSSILFKEEDFNKYRNIYPSFLLKLDKTDFSMLPQGIKDYIEIGERENVHTGFKCRIRPRWFVVPSIYIPDAFMFRQIHRYPLLVVNEARVTSTDTIHRVLFKDGVIPRLLAATFFNSLTLAWAEVCGRSYGGGVLELEPMEAEELPIPYDPKADIDIEKVDALLRKGNEEEALDYTDGIVLHNILGFDKLMIQKIRKAWWELRDRRNNRRY